MDSVAALGAASTVIATAFALCTIDRWTQRRKAHELAWSQSLVMFAVASGAYWWGASAGWSAGAFRVFYLFGAILNVPYLAMGTVHLLAPGRSAERAHRVLHLVAAWCAGVLLVAPAKPVSGPLLPVGKETFGLLPRIMAAIGSGVGATILIAGALYSAVRLVRARLAAGQDGAGAATAAATRSRLGRLAMTNGFIALGSMVLGVGGALFTGPDAMTAFGVFLTIGITLLFGGFLISPAAPIVADATPPPTDVGPFVLELWEVAQTARRSAQGST